MGKGDKIIWSNGIHPVSEADLNNERLQGQQTDQEATTETKETKKSKRKPKGTTPPGIVVARKKRAEANAEKARLNKLAEGDKRARHELRDANQHSEEESVVGDEAVAAGEAIFDEHSRTSPDSDQEKLREDQDVQESVEETPVALENEPGAEIPASDTVEVDSVPIEVETLGLDKRNERPISPFATKLFLFDQQGRPMPEDVRKQTQEIVWRAQKVMTPEEFYSIWLTDPSWEEKFGRIVRTRDISASTKRPNPSSPVSMDIDRVNDEALRYGAAPEAVEKSDDGRMSAKLAYDAAREVLIQTRREIEKNAKNKHGSKAPALIWERAMRSSNPLSTLADLQALRNILQLNEESSEGIFTKSDEEIAELVTGAKRHILSETTLTEDELNRVMLSPDALEKIKAAKKPREIKTEVKTEESTEKPAEVHDLELVPKATEARGGELSEAEPLKAEIPEYSEAVKERLTTLQYRTEIKKIRQIEDPAVRNAEMDKFITRNFPNLKEIFAIPEVGKDVRNRFLTIHIREVDRGPVAILELKSKRAVDSLAQGTGSTEELKSDQEVDVSAPTGEDEAKKVPEELPVIEQPKNINVGQKADESASSELGTLPPEWADLSSHEHLQETESTAPPLDHEGARSMDALTESQPSAREPKPYVSGSAEEKELLEKLGVAREAYVRAFKALDDRKGVKAFIVDFFNPNKRQELYEQYSHAYSEYQGLRAELVIGSFERLMEEKTKLVETRLAEYAKRERGRAEKAYAYYKKLGELNLHALFIKAGFEVDFKIPKAVLKSVNARTVTSFGLLGVGVALGPTSLGLSSLFARRALSGTSAGVGSYDLLRGLRERSFRKGLELNLEDIKTVAEADEYISKLESRALLDGLTPAEFSQDTVYNQLLKKRFSLAQAEFESEDAAKQSDARFNYLLTGIYDTERDLWKKLGSERRKRLALKATAALIGGMVGTGAAKYGIDKAIKFMSGDEAELVQRPTTGFRSGPVAETTEPHASSKTLEISQAQAARSQTEIASLTENEPAVEQAPEQASAQVITETTVKPGAAEIKPTITEITHGQEETGARIEEYGSNSVVHAGRRGIEGALIDLKDTQPEKYSKMMGWLKQQYPNSRTSDSSLIHKFIMEKSNGMEGDINRIISGEVAIKPDGGIDFDADKFKFMQEHSIHSGAATTGIPENELGAKGINFEEVGHKLPAEEPPPLESRPSVDPGRMVTSDVTDLSKQADLDLYDKAAELKPSKAIDLVLSESQEKAFLKDIKLDGGALDKIRNMTYSEFLQSCSVKEKFGKEYSLLKEVLGKKTVKPSTKMQKAILDLAIIWKSKH